MDTYQKMQAVMSVITLIGIILVAYRAIFTPQQNNERASAVLTEEMKAMKADLVNLRDNHVHTLDTKIDKTNESVQSLAIQITRLNTIIEERIERITKK